MGPGSGDQTIWDDDLWPLLFWVGMIMLAEGCFRLWPYRHHARAVLGVLEMPAA